MVDTTCPSCGASSKSPYVCLNCGEPLGRGPSETSGFVELSDVDHAFAALDAEADAEIDSADAAARRRALARWMPSSQSRPPLEPSTRAREDEAVAALAAEMRAIEVTPRAPRLPRLPPPERPPTGTITEADRAFAALSAEIESGETLDSGGASTFSKRRILIGLAAAGAFSLVFAVATMFYAPISTTAGQLSPREAIAQDAQTMVLIEKHASEQARAPDADPRYVATAQELMLGMVNDDRRADLRRLDKGDQAVADASNAVADHAEAFLKALSDGRDDDVKSEHDATTAAMADLSKALSQPLPAPHR